MTPANSVVEFKCRLAEYGYFTKTFCFAYSSVLKCILHSYMNNVRLPSGVLTASHVVTSRLFFVQLTPVTCGAICDLLFLSWIFQNK